MFPPVKLALLAVCSLLLSNYSFGWANHTLISQGMLESMPEVAQAKKVKVESIENFLLATEDQLVTFLAKEELWMKHNLFHYAPLPSALAFKPPVRLRIFVNASVMPYALTPIPRSIYTYNSIPEKKSLEE